MKSFFRFLLGAALALAAGATAHAAARISPTSISASPGAAAPGDQVTLNLGITNSAAATTAPTNQNDFGAGNSATATVTFTHLVTGSTFTRAVTVTNPATVVEDGGAGTFTGTFTVPTQTTQAGSYRAIVVLSAISGGHAIASSTYSVSTGILTVTGKPDLRISSLTYPAGTAYKGGDRITMSLNYRNLSSSNGTANVPFVPGINGDASFARIDVVLSSNPTFGDADDFLLTSHDIAVTTNADDADHNLTWSQVLPGNFTGSFYVMAKIDALSAVSESIDNDLTLNGNNTWTSENDGTRINLDPINFPTISWASSGSNGYSDNPSVSADGRYTVFASDATTLVTGDTNSTRDIFLYDNGSTSSPIRRINLSQQGGQTNGQSNNPVISGDGAYVAFSSEATNLTTADTNLFPDIYVVNVITKLLTRVSVPLVSSLGTQANGSSFRPAISHTGRYVVFESSATNLVAGGTAVGVTHVYRVDRDVSNSGTFDTPGNTAIVLVSVNAAAVPGNGNSQHPSISGDGRYVAFSSDASNLGGTVLAVRNVYLRDLTSNTTTLVSVAGGGANGSSRTPSLNQSPTVGGVADPDDGRYVVFSSEASNLIGGDTNAVSDIFVFDRTTSAIVRVSVSSAGAQAVDPSAATFRIGSVNPSISKTGRYVAFASLANNLTDGNAGGQYSATDSNGALDIFVMDRQVSGTGAFDAAGNIATTMASRNRFGYQTQGLLGAPSTAASDIFPRISADGRYVAFPSDAENTGGLVHGATNRTSPDSNQYRDIFVHDRRINTLPGDSLRPTVTITSPGNNTSTLVNTAVNITASASVAFLNGVPQGQVANVEFFANGVSVGVDTSPPYQATWTPTAAGVFTITAKVTDNFGSQGESSNISVNVNATPSIGITSPAAGSQITLGSSPTTVTITATAGASNSNGVITQVEFFVNNELIGSPDTTAPYGIAWTPTVAGPYTIKARATERIGPNLTDPTTTTMSPDVNVSVVSPGSGNNGGTPPTVSLSPLPPTTTSINARITLSANAAPGAGSTASIANVRFLANGVLIGTATTAPYTVTWVPTALGTFNITAVATDTANSTGTSAAATVTVNGTLSVAITSPSAGVVLPVNTSTAVTATAGATNGTIVNVRFFANDVAIGTASSFPYTINWTPATAGIFSLLAVATDNTGAQTNSSVVAVSVGTGTPPTVAISSPAAGTSVPVGALQTIVANATAGSGTIASVQFFANGSSLGTDTSFPYNQEWTPAGTGTVELTAIATDNLGNRTSSSVVMITVAPVSPGAPAVGVTSPSAGASLVVGTSTTVTANATDSDGTIAKVEFFANGVLLGSDTSYPYSVTFTPGATGNYTITAVATDNGGNVSTSAPVGVTVSGGTAPAVAIVAPAVGSTLDVNVPQTILATATSTSGVVASVEFLVNGVSLSSKTSFPYSAAWTPSAVGVYSLTARATDNFGNVTTSAPISVTVSAGSPNLPVIALTSTPNGTRVTVNSEVFISANAQDPDGFVNNVEFYVNDRLVGSRNGAPYFAAWVPSTPGTYTVRATVTDDAGNRVNSAPATITAIAQVGNVPRTLLEFNNPTVDVVPNPPAINPLTPVKVDYGSKLIISADAVKDDGTITNVQFFANGISIGSLTAAPYFTTWQLNTLSDVVLVALITDSSGNTVFTQPILIDTQPSLGAESALVTLASPLNGSTYVNGGQIIFSATHNFGTVTPPKIDFYVNGSQFTTVTAATGGAASSPYQYIIGLTVAGNYVIHAVGRQGNTTTVSSAARITVTNSRAPTVAITSPAVGTNYTVGTGLTIAANAASTTGLIQNVQFFVNGAALSTKNTTPYTAAWNPGAAGTYTLTAIATDDSGNQTLSAPVVLTLVANAAPTISITSPSTGTATNAGSIVNLVAAAADADGTVATVRFLANGNAVGNSVTAAPFSTAWTPTAPGTYSVIAQATDNSGNVTNSSPINIVVAGNRAPAVALTSPSNGSVMRSGSSTQVTANATDADGTIASVQFFANGVAIGAPVTALPYRAQWTPGAEGVFRITAVAIDNAGAATTSSVLSILVVDAATGATDSVYTGDYSGNGEAGRFAAITVRGKTAAFIGYSTLGATKTYFFPGLPVDGNGSFSVVDSLGRTALTARGSDTGLSGTLDGGRIIAIGINAGLFPATRTVATGYYTGGLTGRPSSTLAAIVGADGSITAYVADGTFQSAGSGAVDAQGNFTINATSGVRLTGKADPATGFLTGTLTGAGTLTFSGAIASGVSFSDGFLRNLSTRGQVGTGSNILIAGFVVGGSTAKQVLIRAIGPTLSTFGLTGVLADPQLQIFNSSGAMIASNNNWSGSGDVAGASAAVGAFPLASNSLDAALVASLAPGAYTAQVAGVGGGQGIALVELYDVDTLTPFSSQKVINVATRGVAGQDDRQLIAGFVVSGNTPKKVLVRAVGPTLAAAPFNVAGVLVDPLLRIVRSDNVVVRENDNWESGNDAALVTDAASRIGAFPLAAGSKDSAILINLPPGTYSAQATGAGTSTGVALVEVYEIP